MKWASTILLAVVAVVVLALQPACAADFPLTVHLVPHSHEDVGYEKTLDEYWYGSNQSIRATGVQYRMDSIVPALEADPTRRFIQVEIAFFYPWWQQQDDAMRERFKALVRNGQMELVSGGWCMHDEATTLAVDQIDQQTLGHKFLLDNFGPEHGVPRTGWQIDPFGHSSTANALFKAMGFDSLYVCRIDWEDKLARMMSQEMEWIWDSSPSLGSAASSLWGGTFVSHYGAPPGFCLDDACDGGADEPIMDDPRLEDDNVLSRVDEFTALMLANAPWFKGSDVLITMGGDFLYSNAARNFKEMDKLIKYVNEAAKGKIVLKYSTPAEYTAAKMASNLTYTVKTDDFFPYADQAHSYWTGFFTSRPLLKRMVRSSSALLQAAKQLEFLAGAGTGATQGPTRALQEAVAVAQHHDAVSGTEMQHVAYDYALRMAKGGAAAQQMMGEALGAMLTPAEGGAQPPQLVQCVVAYNESVCPYTQSATQPSSAPQPLLVLVYNSQAHRVVQRVSLPVERADLLVLDSDQQKVLLQQVVDNDAADAEGQAEYASRAGIRRRNAVREEQRRTGSASAGVRSLRRGEKKQTVPKRGEAVDDVPARYTLSFMADVAPLGVQSYFVVPAAASSTAVSVGKAKTQRKAAQLAEESAAPADDLVTLNNALVGLSFSSSSGLLVGYTDAVTGESFALSQEWLYYESFVDPTGASPNAGAYISRFSNDNVPFPIGSTSGPVANLTVLSRGPVVWEVRQQFAPWCAQTVRLVAGSRAVEIEWSVGPVPLTDSDGVARGKEVITRFSTDPSSAPAPFNSARGIDNGGVWYSDSNGREFIRRQRDYRATWNVSHEEPVASNYVPVNAAVYMNDAETAAAGSSVAQLTVLTDRSAGCASISNRSMEIMVHRRLVADDNKGVHEPLNETTSITPYPNPVRIGPGIVVKGKHTLLLVSSSSASSSSFASAYRPAQAAVYQPLQVLYSSLGSDSVASYLKAHRAALSFATELPANLELMTLQEWDNGTALVRLAHAYARDEDPVLSQAVTFDLATLLPARGVLLAAEELSLTTNQKAAELAVRKPFDLRRDARAPKENVWADEGKPLRQGETVVTISSMQIRTFQLTYASTALEQVAENAAQAAETAAA